MDKRILIVDDTMSMRKVTRKVLNEGGCQDVSEAQDGEEAMAVFRQVKPGLVLLDIAMPGKSGLGVLEEMPAKEPGTRIVMYSAVGQRMMIQRALVAGAVDFIAKSFKVDESMRVVDCHLNSQRLQEQK